MKIYEVVGAPVTLVAGTLKLTPNQAAKRKFVLKEASGKGCYTLIAPTQFKIGEKFGFDGDLPANIAVSVATANSKGKAAPKPASKKGKGKAAPKPTPKKDEKAADGADDSVSSANE